MTTVSKLIPSEDAEICAEAFGDPADPAVLLMMGQMASMLWWPEAFCGPLADAGRYVIRFDNRDTGRSTAYEPGSPPYTGETMAGDAIAVLDGFNIDRAHLVGQSMGGALAQLAAARYPERVATLTLISTSPIVGGHADLPAPDPGYMKQASEAAEPDWSDRDSIAEYILADARALSSVRHPFDEAGMRELLRRDLERARRPESLVNHTLLPHDDPGPLEIAAPLLVVHGDADPLFPIAHGEAWNTELVRLEGGGHVLHEGDWDRVIAAIVRHTA